MLKGFNLSELSPDHKICPGTAGLETLLSLDGSIFEMGQGYWVKMRVQTVNSDLNRPAGISYSLTLHAPSGERLVGFDNAHAVRRGAGPGGGSKPPFDHAHFGGRTKRYDYQDPEQLLCDFWQAVNLMLELEGVKQ